MRYSLVLVMCLSLVPFATAAGLLYPSGIEPGNPSVCEATGGSRCWWVDANAPAGGDGSYANPYNSFEKVVGYIVYQANGNINSYVTGQLQAGDYLYVKGTFLASANVPATHETSIGIVNGNQCGTPANPTVIKSWRGSQAAVFDGEFQKNSLIGIYGGGSTPCNGIRIQNVEVIHHAGRGITIGDSGIYAHVTYADIVSISVHDGIGDYNLGTGGGILFGANEAYLYNFTLRNSLFYNNKMNYSGQNDNNVGGVSVLSEPAALAGSILQIHDNEIYGEIHAIREKHQGTIKVEAYNNTIHDNKDGFYMHSWSNDFHNNIMYNLPGGFYSDPDGNQIGNVEYWIHSNTLYNVSQALTASPDGSTTFTRIIHFYDNIYYNPQSLSGGIISLGDYPSAVITINGWTFNNNLYYFSPAAYSSFLVRPSGSYAFAPGLAALNDITSTFGDALLVNPPQNFSVQAGSPAIAKSSTGGTIGAISYTAAPPTGICEANVSAGKKCLYVAPDGDNGNDGSFARPFKTFLPALTRVNPGDIIYARGGTYGPANRMVYTGVVDYNTTDIGAQNCAAGGVYAAFANGHSYCVYDAYNMIAIKDFSGWASNSPAYSVASGTPEHPITVRNYPGERPVLVMDNNTTGVNGITIEYKSWWIIEGLEVANGGIDLYRSHDIWIQNNNVHNRYGWPGYNTGLIYIERSDYPNVGNIYIYNNTLHDMYDLGCDGVLDNTACLDQEHLSAVTTMSCEGYTQDLNCGGTKYVEIVNNTIYNMPQAFFFKNPMVGPILIENNHIYNSFRLGILGSANVIMRKNLIENVTGGWGTVGSAGTSELVAPLSGENATIEYNTFVNTTYLMNIERGFSHNIKNNVFFGFPTPTPMYPDWNPPAYIMKSCNYPDSVNETQSYLHGIKSDDNCFITPISNFQMIKRFYDCGSGIAHYNYTQAQSIFGWDTHSIFLQETNQNSVFENSAAGDYHLKAGSVYATQCGAMGVYANGTTGITWPNEPSGFTQITDYGFPTAIPVSADASLGDGSGWHAKNSQGYVTVINDATAPVSPTKTVQFLYPIGFQGGAEPGSLYYDHSPQKEVYAGIIWKPSIPWQNEQSNVNKIMYWFDGSGSDFLLDMHWAGDHYQIQSYDPFGNHITPNVIVTPVTLGVWHRIEWYIKYASTPGGTDGIMKWWLDGVLQANITNLHTQNDTGFGEFQIAPTWGGGGSTKSENDYYWFDHVHISRAANNTGLSPPSQRPGDLNDDGKVDFLDLLIVIGQFRHTGAGITNIRADINNDNTVNLFDFVLLAKNWGKVYT